MTNTEQAQTATLGISTSGPEDGPAVVLLHGWGSSAELMRPFAHALSDRYRVMNLDLPGHGTAPAPRAALDMEAHAKAVFAYLPEEGAHLIGHSNGGRIALYMASDVRYGERIRSLTLISPSGVRRPRGVGYRVRSTLARVLKAPFQVLPSALREPGLDWLRHSLAWKLLGSSDYRALTGSMRGTFVHLVGTYVENRLKDIASPTLLFWGDEDTAVIRPQIAVLEEQIPDCGLVVLRGAGHYGYLDQPEIVMEGTRRFLDSIDTPVSAAPQVAP